ncbi:MAG: hypothetical protein JWQ57_979 [Mucilaginibacter sp.]|nr:hypothetical protein [Mucilaginibacter sp.]
MSYNVILLITCLHTFNIVLLSVIYNLRTLTYFKLDEI